MTPSLRNLVIFARRPQLGAGKRRLAAEIGDLEAHRFQRAAIRALLRNLGDDARWRTHVAATPDRPLDWTGGTPALPQGRGDLGARLDRLARQFGQGLLVVVGSDAPQISRQHVADAFRRLGDHDAVFGPTPDGGYWLVGLRLRPAMSPFTGVRWSTPDALTDTLANLAGRRVAFLPMLEDVDDAASLARVRACLQRPSARP